MKKTLVVIIVSLVMMAGAVYAANQVKSSVVKNASGIEAVDNDPDKDPKAKSCSDAKDKSCCTDDKSCKKDGKSCCTDDKSCKKDGKSCESSKKAEGASNCCSKSKTETGAVAPASTGSASASAEKTNCPKTKCQ